MISKFIFVGDMHVKRSNLEESQRLMDWIIEEATKRKLAVVFSGDQYNDFGMSHVDVVDFWSRNYTDMTKKLMAVYSIVGNHDQNFDGTKSFMSVHKDTAVFDEPSITVDFGPDVLFLPFFRKNEDFIQAIKDNPAKVVICHQEFNGCQYENGFYSPHGCDPKEIPVVVEWVLSGHIHKEQSFDKIQYPGTPRQLTRSDIGSEKGIFVINLEDYSMEKIPTPAEVCEPFTHIEITAETDLKKIKITDSSRVFVDIKGSSDFVKKALKKMPQSAKVRTFPDSEAVNIEVKESEGIQQAFAKYAEAYLEGNDNASSVLKKVYDKCPALK